MKKLLLIAVLIAACLSATAYVACVAAPLLGKNIKGSGKIVAKTVPAPDFDGIEASRAVKVVISDKVSDIRIEADDNLIDLVVVRAVKGKLEATLDQKVNNIQNGNVTITVPANGKIRSLDASSASKIIGETTLKAGKFSIEASSAAKIKAAVEAVSCTIETSSASKVEASVEAESCSLDASSASKIILEGSAGTFKGRHEFGIETQRRKILGRQRLDRHIERRQRFDRLQRKTHRQRIERLVGPLLGRLPDFAGKVERRQHPQTLNSETTRQP